MVQCQQGKIHGTASQSFQEWAIPDPYDHSLLWAKLRSLWLKGWGGFFSAECCCWVLFNVQLSNGWIIQRQRVQSQGNLPKLGDPECCRWQLWEMSFQGITGWEIWSGTGRDSIPPSWRNGSSPSQWGKPLLIWQTEILPRMAPWASIPAGVGSAKNKRSGEMLGVEILLEAPGSCSRKSLQCFPK